jgi:hypothetical protein
MSWWKPGCSPEQVYDAALIERCRLADLNAKRQTMPKTPPVPPQPIAPAVEESEGDLPPLKPPPKHAKDLCPETRRRKTPERRSELGRAIDSSPASPYRHEARTAATPKRPGARGALYPCRKGATIRSHVRGLRPYHRGCLAVRRPAGLIRHPVGRATLPSTSSFRPH